MALSALLLLLPILLNLQKIPDESVQSDMNAVYSAISSENQWKDPRSSLATLDSQLTTPQRALAKMHWELETIQKEKPVAPPQFDLGLFSEALEAMVEMDEERKEVKMRTDKLNEWAGGEKAAKEEEEKAMEEEKKRKEDEGKETEKEQQTVEESGKEGATVQAAAGPEVTVNENGNIVLKNGQGGEGRMQVRRRKDENGNEEVVVTFVKGDEPEGRKDEKPQEEQREQREHTEQAPKMVGMPSNAKFTTVPMPTLSSSAASVEEEVKKGRTVGEEIPERNEPQRKEEEAYEGNVMVDDERITDRANDVQFEIVRGPKNVGDFAGGWFGTPFFDGRGPFGSLFNLFFGRKKRETVVRENVQTMADGRTIRTMEKLTTSGKPGSGFMTKVVDFAVSVNGAEGGKQTNAVDETVRRSNWTVKQGGTDAKSANDSPKTMEANGGAEMSEKNNETKKDAGEKEPQEERKAEIKQYLEMGLASADGQKKLEKLAYVWYSELLYWTAKWIEMMENRVTEVKPELALQFLSSNTGLAAHKELEDEMEKCEAKLAKLKEWVGGYFK